MLPLFFVCRLARQERDAKRAEIGSAAGLFRTGVHIGVRFDFERDEPCGRNSQLDLSLQESAGNSTGPECDVVLRALRNRLLDHDVADLQPAAGLQHTSHLA